MKGTNSNLVHETIYQSQGLPVLSVPLENNGK